MKRRNSISGVWVQIPPVPLFAYLYCIIKSISQIMMIARKSITSFHSNLSLPMIVLPQLIIYFQIYQQLQIMRKATSVLLLVVLVVFVSARSEYKVVSTVKNTTSVTLTLSYTGAQDYHIKANNPIIKTLNFHYQTHTFFDFSFKITDSNNKRYEIPSGGVFPFDPEGNFTFPSANSGVTFEYTESPFDFKIVRKQNGAVIFSTYDQQIIFSDHYIEIGTEVDSDYIYGIGERFQQSFRKRDGKWTVFNRDRGQVIDRGTGLQTYGYYPFYLLRERNNIFHINYFRSTNAMDVIKSINSNKHFITYKVIGGVIDFRFFLGEQNPEAVVERLNSYSGRSAIPPFWSFGFHQCRWGYDSVSKLEDVTSGYEKNGIPLDTIWSDIDYMIDYEDFTINENKFPLDRMNKILDKYHYIPIIDAGIKNSGSAYEEGLKRGVYVLESNSQKPYVGKVWPGPTTFVDFFHPNSTQYWSDMLGRLYDKVKFSGIWLDMNELANFCDGACQSPSGSYIYDYSQDLPYQPGSDNIEAHTISLNATHYGNLTQANVHVFSGFLQTYATNVFLKSKYIRPFIITRSSTFGSSKYGFHWTGDNYASWQYLKGSIADNFNNQMFGFQMVGPDICGFGGNTNAELCARWFQLGSLYTFARNHNDHDSISQQAYALGDTVIQAAKNNLKLRYSLLKHFYFLFLNKRGLGTIWRPLFFQFPLDSNNYLDDIADTQFMIGADILVTPIVEQGQTSRKIYLPDSNWYYFHSGVKFSPGTHLLEGVGLTDKVPMFLREGFAIVAQDTSNVVNTKQLDNTFLILTGMKYDTRRSNSTTKIYESAGAMLSIRDYNDNSLVDLCLNERCQYVFTMLANLTSTARTLEINFNYIGGPRLNEAVRFSAIHLTLDTEIIVISLETPIEVTGTKRVSVPIPKATNIVSNLMTEDEKYVTDII